MFEICEFHKSKVRNKIKEACNIGDAVLMVTGELPPGELPPGELPPGELPPGELPPGELPPGELPPSELPPVQEKII